MSTKMQANKTWALGAALLALAVMIGAFGAHGLQKFVTPDKLITFETGVRYHFYHALGILFFAAFRDLYSPKKTNLVTGAFLTGILLFSFNCYLYVLTDIKTFAMIVPVGGTMFIVGWLAFAWSALKAR